MESSKKQDEAQEHSVMLTEDHPWLEISDVSVDESILYSLDELRFV